MFRDVAVRFAPDAIFHLAAQVDVRRSVVEPAEDASINVAGTVNVLAAAVAAGVENVVFASSGGAVFGEAKTLPTPDRAPRLPRSPYGVSKMIVDDYLRYFKAEHGLNYVSLGFANVYGPRQDPHGEAGVVAIFTGKLLEGDRPVIYGDGSQSRDYVFVEDVTDACVRAASYSGGSYLNIGTGVETTVRDLFSLLRELTGSDLEPIYADERSGDVARSALDASMAAKAIGWRPWTSLEKGLQLTVDWFAAQGS